MGQTEFNTNTWKVNRTDRRTFDLFLGEELVARIIYPRWNRYNADIDMAGGGKYSFKRKSFWRNSHAFLTMEKEIGLLKVTWGGAIRFTLTWENLAREYIFKRRNIWKTTFVLSNSAGAELFTIQQQFRWKEFAYQYHAESGITQADELDKLLFVLSVYFTNFLLAQSASEAAAAIS